MRIAFILMIAATFAACTKDHSPTPQKDYLESTFKVGEQVNVSHYIHQVSVDGVNFKDGNSVQADENKTSYTILTDANDLFKQSSTLYSRIVAVDKDGNRTISKTIQTVKK